MPPPLLILCKIDVFLKKIFSTPRHGPYKLMYSNDDQGRVYQNCTFHDPRGRGSCAGAWSYKSYNKNALFLLKSFSLLKGIEQTNQL